VLQCLAVRFSCSVWQFVAVFCTVVHCIVAFACSSCNVFQYVAMYCNVLQCIAVYCSVLKCILVAVCCNRIAVYCRARQGRAWPRMILPVV